MKAFILSCVTVLFYSVIATGQSKSLTKLQSQVQGAIEKGHPASVFIANYDPQTKRPSSGRFSGVVIDGEGRILTAAHACSPEKYYQVTFPDGKQYVARGLGSISRLDVAIMKITEAGKWPYAEMGWSSSLKVNEPVVSIAYPGSFIPQREVIRLGYVAQLDAQRGRRFRSTCLMEPGDSGGPVFDLYGRVVGLHSSIDNSLENNYEIPVDFYRKYWTALQKPVAYKDLPSEDVISADPLLAGKADIGDMKLIAEGIPKLETKMEAAAFKIISGDTLSGKTILGTLISLDGIKSKDDILGKSYLLSKNSMVAADPKVDLGKGRLISAKIVHRDLQSDLVLLELGVKLKKGIKIGKIPTDTLTFKDLGALLISPQPDNEGEWSGVSTQRFDLKGMYSAGYLGAGVEIKDARLVLSMVAPNSPASLAKLEVGGQIVSVNGLSLGDPESFVKAVQKNQPDDILKLVVMKSDKVDTLAIKLGKRPMIASNHIAEKFTDGKSERRDGFANAFVHDAKLKPTECGGPVFDIYGKFMGINMARYSRTSSIAVTVAEIRKFIEGCDVEN